MNWFDEIEKKLSKFAIRGLITYIIAGTSFVYLLSHINNETVYKLMLIPEMVKQGEIWRLVTYIFIPPSASPIFIIFVLYFYYMIGSSLGQEWGSFRFNIYYLFGMLGTSIAALLTGSATSLHLNLSLFLACAKLFPNYEILLFFFLPVKIKYLGWLNWLFIAYTVITAEPFLKAAALVSILNYFVFFGKDTLKGTANSRNVYNNRKRFKADIPHRASIHKCSKCGVTENDNPKMEFRYCSKCEGHFEYCMNHLKEHEHKVSNDI